MTLIELQRQARRASVSELAGQLKALSDPTRLALVALLAQREHCVCDLTAVLHLPQSTCSHHLGVLKRAGLVCDRRDDRDARWAYYTLVPAAVERLRTELNRSPHETYIPDAEHYVNCIRALV